MEDQEDSLILSMGFATNSTVIPALVKKGDLVISDQLNHTSIVYGARASGATVCPFKHNDPHDLEKLLRRRIAQGDPKTGKKWGKIVVIVEGLYSMEGSICALPEIVALKRKYGFYLYLDEAHSIGAMGPSGRGICDYFGIDYNNIDILMGSFAKSFGSAGGYIAGRKEVIDHLRYNCHSSIYGEPMSVPALQQVHSTLQVIMGVIGDGDGTPTPKL
jgi:serine palmitoyltransferase